MKRFALAVATALLAAAAPASFAQNYPTKPVRIINPLAEQRSRFTLGSVGGGLRLRLFKHLVGGLTVGVPLTTLSDSERGKARVVFTARGEF